MKISYNWLKQYINIDLDAETTAKILTDCGLEVESFEKFESVKGGLHGVVIGEVLTCSKHPNADKLSLTKVSVGSGLPLNIVCGAPNVAAGQKVLVATIGTTIYKGLESFQITEAKIRGELSQGMLCAEDELGLGVSHNGIMVLPIDAIVGTPANKYFSIYEDVVFEIGLTPNRVDAASHLGVARDLIAVLNAHGMANNIVLSQPDVSNFKVDNSDLDIQVIVEDQLACPRYSGLTITGIKVQESPEWLKNSLLSIGLRPINNIVDITNYILFESGHPLHAFDADLVKGNKVIVKTLATASKFITLDSIERELTDKDLMICNETEGMCIAGVYGGLKSGVTESTTSIFLESAYFNPVYIRRTSKYHGLKTDASFRFERGADPDITVFALKRAAMLIKEVAGGTISSEIKDYYPTPISPFSTKLKYANVDSLIGKSIDRTTIKKILNDLGISITEENSDGLTLSVPLFKVDVQREADVIEEILRIYGYNNIEFEESVKYSMVGTPKPDFDKLRNIAASQLNGQGFSEIMCNSLTKTQYERISESFKPEESVRILNPLSKDLEIMRPSLLFGGLETIQYNQNRKNSDLKLFEFGSIYRYNESASAESNSLKRYFEEEHLAVFASGREQSESWTGNTKVADLYTAKSVIYKLLEKLGVPVWKLNLAPTSADVYSNGYQLLDNGIVVAEFGEVANGLLKHFDIKSRVFTGFIRWKIVMNLVKNLTIQYASLPKFPEVRRDLALLVDNAIPFLDIERIAYETEKVLLQKVGIFDIYEGDKIPAGQKSYAISFTLRDANKTLTDDEIDRVMNKLIKAYQTKLNATLR